jgi:hypothetical protein
VISRGRTSRRYSNTPLGASEQGLTSCQTWRQYVYQSGSTAPLLAREIVTPMTRTERRLAERFGLKIPLRVRIAKPAALDHTAESLNISTRGISFATDLPLCKGTPVHVAFEMPEQVTCKPASEWRCTGHVVHVQPNGSPHGAIVGVGFDCYEVLQPVRATRELSLPPG